MDIRIVILLTLGGLFSGGTLLGCILKRENRLATGIALMLFAVYICFLAACLGDYMKREVLGWAVFGFAILIAIIGAGVTRIQFLMWHLLPMLGAGLSAVIGKFTGNEWLMVYPFFIAAAIILLPYLLFLGAGGGGGDESSEIAAKREKSFLQAPGLPMSKGEKDAYHKGYIDYRRYQTEKPPEYKLYECKGRYEKDAYEKGWEDSRKGKGRRAQW